MSLLQNGTGNQASYEPLMCQLRGTLQQVLNFEPRISVENSVKDMVEKIRRFGYKDCGNPRYYNIE